MFFVIFLFYLPTLVLPQLNSEVSTSYIKATKLECYFDPKWLVNGSCKLKPKNWETTLVNLTWDMKQPLRNVSVRMEVFRHETLYVPFLINVTTNICDILRNKGVTFYTRIVIGLWKRYATMDFVTCPMNGHVEVRNAYLDVKFTKYIMPKGLYRVVLSGSEGSESIGSLILHAVVGEHFRKLNKSRVNLVF